jgi:hypothetical protein
MEVLKRNAEYISSRVSVEDIAERLKDVSLVSREEYLDICSKRCNQDSYKELLNLLNCKFNTEECSYFIWNIIRSDYRAVSQNIKEIELGLRMKVPIGTQGNTILTVALYDGEPAIDIRKYKVTY